MLQYAPYLPRCTFCSFLVYSVLLGQVVHFQTQNFTNPIIECMSNSSAQLTGFHIKCYINAKFEIVMMVIAFASHVCIYYGPLKSMCMIELLSIMSKRACTVHLETNTYTLHALYNESIKNEKSSNEGVVVYKRKL